MGGFNPINLIFNTVSIAALNAGNQTQANKNALENFSAAQNTSSSAGSSVLSNRNTSFAQINHANLNQTTRNVLSSANQIIISTVEIEQRANYIKDLLNLPRDFESLMNQIQTTDNSALKELGKLLVNGKIDLNALSNLLSNSSENAVQKLMTTIIDISKMGSNNISQLKELMGLLSNAATQDSVQTVKNLLLLYLPWLPLSVRKELNLDFNIDIFDKIKGADPDEENQIETVKIMIQTANYGNILAVLELALNNEIDILIEAGDNFPEEKVIEKFKDENKKQNIRTNVSIDKNKGTGENMMQNIQIVSSNFVSPKLVLAAHSLIKIIIDVDNCEFILKEEK